MIDDTPKSDSAGEHDPLVVALERHEKAAKELRKAAQGVIIAAERHIRAYLLGEDVELLTPLLGDGDPLARRAAEALIHHVGDLLAHDVRLAAIELGRSQSLFLLHVGDAGWIVEHLAVERLVEMGHDVEGQDSKVRTILVDVGRRLNHRKGVDHTRALLAGEFLRGRLSKARAELQTEIERPRQLQVVS